MKPRLQQGILTTVPITQFSRFSVTVLIFCVIESELSLEGAADIKLMCSILKPERNR